jgi:dinuclear metal center YbgI/SA1388 family protein
MLTQYTLKSYLQQLLAVDQFKDYCPNGLQVAHQKASIQKIISGVTINQKLIDQAILYQADAILVHHGLFWKGDSPCIDGLLYQRLHKLLDHGIALFAYHLPLDAHAVYGNNAQLGKKFDLRSDFFAGEQNLIHIHDVLADHSGSTDANTATNHDLKSINAFDLVQKIESQLANILLADVDQNSCKNQVENKVIPPLQYIDQYGHAFGSNQMHDLQKKRQFKKIAWCSGGAQSYFPAAIAAGADVFITGEISEQYVHMAQELDVAYIAAGHHATERFAVQALGQHLAEKFGIQHHYIDILSLV